MPDTEKKEKKKHAVAYGRDWPGQHPCAASIQTLQSLQAAGSLIRPPQADSRVCPPFPPPQRVIALLPGRTSPHAQPSSAPSPSAGGPHPLQPHSGTPLHLRAPTCPIAANVERSEYHVDWNRCQHWQNKQCSRPLLLQARGRCSYPRSMRPGSRALSTIHTSLDAGTLGQPSINCKRQGPGICSMHTHKSMCVGAHDEAEGSFGSHDVGTRLYRSLYSTGESTACLHPTVRGIPAMGSQGNGR